MQRGRGTSLYIGDAPSQELSGAGQAGSQTTYRETIDHVFPTLYTWSPTRPSVALKTDVPRLVDLDPSTWPPDDDEDWRPSKKPRAPMPAPSQPTEEEIQGIMATDPRTTPQDIAVGNHGQAGSQTTYRETIRHVFPTRYTWSPTRPDDDEDWRPSKKPRWQ